MQTAKPSEAKRVCHFRLKGNLNSRQLILRVVGDPDGCSLRGGGRSVCSNERKEVCVLYFRIYVRSAQLVEGIDPSRPQ